MTLIKPSEEAVKIIRFWLKDLYQDVPCTFLSIDYSKANPPQGTAKFYSDSPNPFTVVFECKSTISMDENPFSYRRDPRD